MASILEQSGAQPQRQPKYVPIFIDRAFTGLFTQRAVLHDPSDIVTAKYYGGRQDVLWQGQNVELTNRLTLQRRPGFTAFSTATYPTPPLCSFSFQHSDGTIEVIVDTAGAVYIDNQNGTKTLLVTKAAGAGQTHFVAVAGTLYMGDGVETHKYTPGNANGLIWNWGIVAPTVAPTVSTVESGVAGIFWTGTPATVWSTMGLVDDVANTTVYQLQSVDMGGVNPTNTTQFGTSGPGQPTWAGPGGSTTDNTCNWVNFGPIVAWTKATPYSAANAGGGTLTNPCCVYDPGTHSIYLNVSGGLATSGDTVPKFKAGSGGRTQDGGCTWLWSGDCSKSGTITTWQAGKTIPAGAPGLSNQFSSCVEPTSLVNGLPVAVGATPATVVYLQWCGNGGITSATPTSPFIAGTGRDALQSDGDLDWLCLGSYVWGPTTSYIEWTNNGQAFSAIKVTVGGVNYWQVCTVGGISGAISPGTSYAVTAAVNNGDGTTTYTLSTPLSTAIPKSTTAAPTALTVSGFSNGGNNSLNGGQLTPFPVAVTAPVTATTITVSNANGVNEGSASGTAIYNAWGTVYSNVTADGTAVWTCVGKTVNWTATTQWYLPLAGFIPPSTSSPYGGAAVIDSNNNVEFCISSGLGTATTHPTWATVSNGTPTQSDTADTNAIWFNLEPFTGNSLAWLKGYIYAYSYKARALDDYYSEADPITGVIPVPPGLTQTLPAPTGSLTEAISTASPILTITGANAGAINYVTVVGSLDPQVDTIVIWRTPDGGGPEDMYELTEIPNPAIGANGKATSVVFPDFLPDTATALYPGLNTSIPAPIADSNNPPYASFLPQVYNFERIWGSDGEYVLASGGPDVFTGNPNEAFNPNDEWPFLAPVTRLVKTAQGLVTYLTNSIQVIGGGPATDTFFSVEWAAGIGLLSYNMLDALGGEQYFFSADNQFRVMTPSLQISNAGFPLGDQFANMPSSGSSDAVWSPATGYVAVLQNGTDNCVIVANGATGWYRLNPNQAPQGNAVWSPFASITNGCQMVQTIETAPGVKRLLVGSVSYTFAQLAADAFNRVNENPLSDSSNWTLSTTGFAGTPSPLQIVSHKCEGSLASSAPCIDFYTGITWPADQYSETTIAALNTGGRITLYVRASASYAVAYQLTLENDNGSGLYKNYASTHTQIMPITVVPQVGDTWRLAVCGSTLLVYQNGSLVGSVIDSSISSGNPGLGAIVITASVSDAQVSSWAGGSITSGGSRIMERNQSVFTDLGTAYDAWFTMGSITLAHPGQIALLKFLEFDFSGSNYQPTISYLLNAISGTFTPFTALPVFDPPTLYGGRNVVPTSYSPLRYYFASNAALARCRHLQIKVDMGTTSTGDELYTMTIFGRLMVET
jgi:hypothetical protein